MSNEILHSTTAKLYKRSRGAYNTWFHMEITTVNYLLTLFDRMSSVLGFEGRVLGFWQLYNLWMFAHCLFGLHEMRNCRSSAVWSKWIDSHCWPLKYFFSILKVGVYMWRTVMHIELWTRFMVSDIYIKNLNNLQHLLTQGLQLSAEPRVFNICIMVPISNMGILVVVVMNQESIFNFWFNISPTVSILRNKYLPHFESVVSSHPLEFKR